MRNNIFFTQQARKYQGSYVAVAKEKVIASGKSAKEAYQLAKNILGRRKKVEGVFYIPQKKDLLTALCAFHTCR